MLLFDLCLCLAGDLVRMTRLLLQSRAELQARLLVSEKQLGMFRERKCRPRRATTREKIALVLLARLHNWKDSIVIVKPRTFLGWMRALTVRNWLRICRESRRRPGRPRLEPEARELIARLAAENPTWSAGKISRELEAKFGMFVTTNTVRKYLGRPGTRTDGDQTWHAFMHNHAKKIVAIDFATVMAPRLFGGVRILYVLVVLHIGSRRLLHLGVTEHPTAEWTANQLREAIPCDAGLKYLIHDNDSIFSKDVDRAAAAIGLRAIRSPYHAPKANAFCERAIGTMRRECLDWIIALGERHLRAVVREWKDHYNHARPHMALGPGIPDPPERLPAAPSPHPHRLPEGARVRSKPILGGLHHEYWLDTFAA